VVFFTLWWLGLGAGDLALEVGAGSGLGFSSTSNMSLLMHLVGASVRLVSR